MADEVRDGHMSDYVLIICYVNIIIVICQRKRYRSLNVFWICLCNVQILDNVIKLTAAQVVATHMSQNIYRGPFWNFFALLTKNATIIAFFRKFFSENAGSFWDPLVRYTLPAKKFNSKIFVLPFFKEMVYARGYQEDILDLRSKFISHL